MLKKQSGFNLIELMIAMSLGIIVVAGAISVFIATSSSNRDVLNAIKLNQELRATMSIIVRGLRRAGSWNYSAAPGGSLMSANPFNQAGSITGTPACDPVVNDCTYTCVEFTYDFPENPNLDQSIAANQPNGIENIVALNSDYTEQFGFGFEDASIKRRQEGTTCAGGMDKWERITDETAVNITNFQVIDRFPASFGDTQIRLLEIRLTGELVNDASVKRDLVEFVRIRNDFLE